jgi:hypothetical protein
MAEGAPCVAADLSWLPSAPPSALRRSGEPRAAGDAERRGEAASLGRALGCWLLLLLLLLCWCCTGVPVLPTRGLCADECVLGSLPVQMLELATDSAIELEGASEPPQSLPSTLAAPPPTITSPSAAARVVSTSGLPFGAAAFVDRADEAAATGFGLLWWTPRSDSSSFFSTASRRERKSSAGRLGGGRAAAPPAGDLDWC